MASRETIYEWLWHGSELARLPGPWERLACHESFRVLTSESLQQILDRFEEADLVAAGLLLHEGGDGAIHPALAQCPALLLFVRRADGQIAQVIANLCGLGPHIGAAAAILQDSTLSEIEKDSEVGLMVVSSMTDLSLFWSLRIPAVVPTGLARLSRAPLHAFVQLLDSRKLFLVLCDCWLSSLELGHSPYLSSVDRHLSELELRLVRNLRHRWWTPSTGRLRNVSYVLEHGSDEEVSNAVYESILVGDPLEESDIPPPPPVAEPRDLPEALARWRDPQRRADPVHRRQSWEAVQVQLRRQIADTLLRQALQHSDPGERTRLTALAAYAPLAISELYQLEAKLALAQLDWRSNVASMSDTQAKRVQEMMRSLLAQLGGRHGDQP